MEVHPFTERHLEEAGRIALAHWGDTVPQLRAGLRPLIYRYLVRYYFEPQSELSFGISDESGLVGMLLAAPALSHTSSSDSDWVEAQLLPEDRDAFAEYKAYLDGNRQKELQYAHADEVILSFFASSRRGGGRLLMQAFEEKSRLLKFNSMLLWTDDTCDFSYYYHNGFEEVAQLPTDPAPWGMSLTTYLFRKHF